MSKEVAILKTDLERKFAYLKSLKQFKDTSRILVWEYFDAVINEVDQAAEELLASNINQNAAWSDQVNANRMEMIILLQSERTHLIDAIPSVLEREENQEFLNILDQRCNIIDAEINQFAYASDTQRETEQGEFADLTQFADAYESIVIDIFELMNKIEEMLIRGSSYFFLESNSTQKQTSFGMLVRLDEYLNTHEIKCIKKLFRSKNEIALYDSSTYNRINQTIEESVNECVSIHIRNPAIISKSLFIIAFLVESFKRLESKNITKTIAYIDENFLDRNKPFVEGMDEELKDTFDEVYNFVRLPDTWQGFDSFAHDHNPFEYFQDKLHEFSLDFEKACNFKFSWLPSKLPRITMRNIKSGQYLEDYLKHFSKNLYYLNLAYSLNAEIEPDLTFLTTLKKISSLDLMLPRATSSLAFLKEMYQLFSLNLDIRVKGSSVKRIELFKHSFIELFQNPGELGILCLSGLQIISINKDTLEIFKNLKHLSLRNNRIKHIEPNSFACLSKLDTIIMDDNEITRIESYTFNRLPRLKSLNLDRNRIQSLEQDCFQELNSLDSLYLKFNDLESLNEGVFNSLNHLRLLDLSNNRLKLIKANVFNLKQLKSLNLNDNPIESIEPYSFSQLISLEKLDMEKCKLKKITNRMFASLTNLERLSISHNEIEKLVVDFDDSQEPLNLNKVNLSSQEVEIVKKNLFVGFDKLKTLTLHHNKLARLDLNCFLNLKSLYYLDLSHNNIVEFDSSTQFAELEEISSIDLSNNQLQTIKRSAFFLANKSLSSLKLSNNSLRRLDSDFFLTFQRLSFLDLHRNQLEMHIDKPTFFHKMSFCGLDVRENISICFNSDPSYTFSKIIELKVDGVRTNGFSLISKYLSKIRKLCVNNSEPLAIINLFSSWSFWNSNFAHVIDLSFNSLTNLENFNFHVHCPNLYELTLTDNHFTTIKSHWFRGLHFLVKLDLSGNRIESLDSDVFHELKNIERINLSRNNIQFIDCFSFKGLIKLKDLDLSNNFNNLRLFDAHFRDLVQLETINLSGNNLKCINLNNLFKRLGNLRSLDLSNNDLDDTCINEKSFENLKRWANLKDLNLSRNQIRRIDFIRNLCHLKRLDLSYNQIESIYDGDNLSLLDRLTFLEHVDLKGNLKLDHSNP